jgi:hypothetical protein
MAQDNLVIFRNVVVPSSATAGQASTVGEPSLGNDGTQIFYTGNWYAARSLNNAGAWTYINPFTTPPAADNGFCCDQTVIYDPSRDITLWLLQYIKKSNTNTLRVAVKLGTGGGPYDFFYDLRPGNVASQWGAEWFDYNSAALSNDFLYITSNGFDGATGVWRRAVVFRIPLDLLASGGAMSYNFFSTTSNGSLRCTLGARDVMYFGSHNSGSSLRLFTWRENSNAVSFNDIAVTPWLGGAYSAPGPDGNNWLSRTDPRITAAWQTCGVAGFMWTANRQTGRPRPFIRAVRIDTATKVKIDEPDIWNNGFAYAYPDACSNDAGGVGLTLFRGGGSAFPTHVVGIWNNTANAWQLADSRAGTNGPADTKWGDYLTCRRHSPDGFTFIASGYTLQGGSQRENVEPRYVHFGSQKYTRAVNRWINA